MKKILLLALLALGALLTAACGSDAAQTSGDAAKAAPVSEPSSAGAPAASQQPAGKGKVLGHTFPAQARITGSAISRRAIPISWPI